MPRPSCAYSARRRTPLGESSADRSAAAPARARAGDHPRPRRACAHRGRRRARQDNSGCVGDVGAPSARDVRPRINSDARRPARTMDCRARRPLRNRGDARRQPPPETTAGGPADWHQSMVDDRNRRRVIRFRQAAGCSSVRLELPMGHRRRRRSAQRRRRQRSSFSVQRSRVTRGVRPPIDSDSAQRRPQRLRLAVRRWRS